MDLADTVDVVEPIAKFTDVLAKGEGVGRVFHMGLEDWRPDEVNDEDGNVRYDVIWNQWCLGHLTDTQLEEYLIRVSDNLTSFFFCVHLFSFLSLPLSPAAPLTLKLKRGRTSLGRERAWTIASRGAS